MEKTEALSKLKKAGYQVQFDSSVVTVLLSKRLNITQETKKIKSFLNEIGYDASFGIKQLKEDSSLGMDYVEEMEISSTDADNKVEVEIEETDVKNTKSDYVEEAEVTIGEQFSLEDFGIS